MTLPKTSTGDCASLRFILVETSRAGNIGAAARAMKTMGFRDLVLVRPRDADPTAHPEAIAFASGAQDLLQGARIVDSIEEALDGCNFAAAVSARLREFSPPVITPRALAAQLAQRGRGPGPGSNSASNSDSNQDPDPDPDQDPDQDKSGQPLHAALVFGNERTGLPNEIVETCNVLINIPANPEYSSLNLAQAVQVLAYECALGMAAGIGAELAPVIAIPQAGSGFQGEPAAIAQIEAMYLHLEQALVQIGFLDPANPRRLMSRLRRLFSRTGLETEEVNILRGIARQMQDVPHPPHAPDAPYEPHQPDAPREPS